MKESSPLVSIIIPVYNRFDVADRAIQSILRQTYFHWELIVVDDYSQKPYVLPVACNSRPQKMLLLRNAPNRGPGLSRQRGWEHAQGEFIAFLDSDDYYDPEFLEVLIRALQEHPEVGSAYCQSIDTTTGELRRRNENGFDFIFSTVVSGFRPWATCSILWRRRSISRWKDLRTNQDALFELDNSLINNQIYFVPQPLCFIDKGTGANSEQLVQRAKVERNRNFVVRYALSISNQVRTDLYDTAERRALVLNRLIFTSAKMIKYGLGQEAILNGKAILRYRPVMGVLILILGIAGRLKFSLLNKILHRLLLLRYRDTSRPSIVR